MLKKLINPLQNILLQRGICPMCTAPLKKAQTHVPQTQKVDKVICKCGNEYIHDKEVNTYSAAPEPEE